jgi:hypothetical protein
LHACHQPLHAERISVVQRLLPEYLAVPPGDQVRLLLVRSSRLETAAALALWLRCRKWTCMPQRLAMQESMLRCGCGVNHLETAFHYIGFLYRLYIKMSVAQEAVISAHCFRW